MKKSLFLLFIIASVFANAQCPVTVNGQVSGSTINICTGACVVFTGGGAQTYTWSVNAGGMTTATATLCPTTTTTYTLWGVSNGGSCLDSNVFTVQVNANPVLTPTAVPSSICSGFSSTLTCSGATTYTWAPGTGLSCTSCAGPQATPMSTTIYTVCGTNFLGCVSCASVVVYINPLPTVSFSMTNISPQVWNATPTYAGGTPAYTYLWSWGDGSPNDVIAYPSHTYTAAAWYNVCATITDANGCMANTCMLDSLYKMSSANSIISLNVVSGSTGITQHEKDTRDFYPNPANEQLFFNENISSMELYDLSGKIVLSRKITGKTALTLSSLPEGIYFIRLKTGEAWVSKKLAIVH